MAERRAPGKRAASRPPPPDGTPPRFRAAPKSPAAKPPHAKTNGAKTAGSKPGGSKPGGGKPRVAVSAARRGAVRPARGGGARRGRWLGIAAIVGGLLVGLPLAHAVLGELGALALGLVVAGFALGRSTMRRG